MRPRQWSKNAFVLGGLIFSGSALHVQPELRAWTTFVAFCLMSGATYLLNDAVDAEADRLNPRTAGRPIARGDLSARTALMSAGLCAALALGLAAVVNWKTLLTLTAFMALQFAYSNWLKHVLFVDVHNGSYTGTHVGPDGKEAPTKGKQTCKWLPGNMWAACDIEMSMGTGKTAMKWMGHLVMGYDMMAKGYRGVMTDNMGMMSVMTPR